MRANLSYANLVATLALFIALGGGAYAVTAQKNSVTSKSVKNNSLKGADVADDSLTGADVAESTLTLPAGAKGDKGDQGVPGANGSPDTAQQVLDKLKTVDGSTPPSGLDADLLGGRKSCGTTSAVVLDAGDPVVKLCEIGTSSLSGECSIIGGQTVAMVSANSTVGPAAQGVANGAGTSIGGGGSGTGLAQDETVGAGGPDADVGHGTFYVVAKSGAQLTGEVGAYAESFDATTGECAFTAAGTGTP